MENNYQNQPYQATYMKGEINFTVRGDDHEKVVEDMEKMVTKYRQWVGAVGTQSAAAPVAVDMKCPVCGSGMHSKIVNKKDGTTQQVSECDNTNCTTSFNYKTGNYEPGKYRTTIWPK